MSHFPYIQCVALSSMRGLFDKKACKPLELSPIILNASKSKSIISLVLCLDKYI